MGIVEGEGGIVFVGADETVEDGGGHEGGDDGHEDEDGEETFGNESALEADVDDDEFHEAAGVHEQANAKGFTDGKACGARGESAGDAFAEDCGAEDKAADEPEEGRVKQADFRVEAGVGEEEGQKEGDGEGLDAGDEIAGHDAAGHGGAHDESAEDGVQADGVGDPCAEGHESESDDEAGFGEGFFMNEAAFEALKEGAKKTEGDSDISGTSADIEESMGPVVVEAREDDGEQAPCGSVVNGACADGHGAHGSSVQALKMDDAGEHWEGGDAERGTQEEHGFEE